MILRIPLPSCKLPEMFPSSLLAKTVRVALEPEVRLGGTKRTPPASSTTEFDVELELVNKMIIWEVGVVDGELCNLTVSEELGVSEMIGTKLEPGDIVTEIVRFAVTVTGLLILSVGLSLSFELVLAIKVPLWVSLKEELNVSEGEALLLWARLRLDVIDTLSLSLKLGETVTVLPKLVELLEELVVSV